MNYEELFRQHDDPIQWEYPQDFDYAACCARFAAFVSDLSASLGSVPEVETGVDIQDASFHSEVCIPLSDGRRLVVRFSNFGDMVTIVVFSKVGDMEFLDADGPVPPVITTHILELLARHRYVYVSAEALSGPYTGANPGVTGIATWWIRYFDWV
ncbi:MAG: hypothetical protein LC772_08685 [Chloroflexi bacterium]|nr:hypothetical protein [Chloroflexota bacterium]